MVDTMKYSKDILGYPEKRMLRWRILITKISVVFYTSTQPLILRASSLKVLNKNDGL